MRYNRRHSRPQPREITVKFYSKCHCCGAHIPAGTVATYYPVGTIAGQLTGVVAHSGGLEGKSARCASEIAARMNSGPDPVDMAYEDQCADACGPGL